MTITADKPKLTAKQRAWANAYVECNNATEAAIVAGYSSTSARYQGYQNTTKDYVMAYVEELSETKGDIYSASVEAKKKRLLDIALDPKAKAADSIKAAHEHSLMCGDHAAQKLNIEGIETPRIVFAPHPSIQIAQIDWPEGMPLLPPDVSNDSHNLLISESSGQSGTDEL